MHSTTISSLGYGLIGPGYIGSQHKARLEAAPDARVVATAGRDLDAVTALLANPEVEAVLIATPHATHVPIALRAFVAGKHVLLEKPVSHRLSEARALSAAWRAAKVRCPSISYGLVFQERVRPVWTRLREFLASRALGRLMRVTWIDTSAYRTMAYFRRDAWRGTWAGEGGGVLLNQSVHQLDLYAWLFGRPARVRAFGAAGKYHDIETEDEVTVLFEHADGLVGHFIASTAEFPGTHRLEIVGEHGRLVWEDGRLVRETTSRSVLRFIDEAASRTDLPTTTREEIALPPGPADAHALILADFTAAVREGRAPLVPGESGEASIELVNAALLAMHLDQAVTLPLDTGAYDDWLASRIVVSRLSR